MVNVEPTASAFYIELFGGFILVVFVLLQKQKIPLKAPVLFLPALCGFIFATDPGLWHQSIHFVGPGLATMLGNLQVFFLMGTGVLINRNRAGHTCPIESSTFRHQSGKLIPCQYCRISHILPENNNCKIFTFLIRL